MRKTHYNNTARQTSMTGGSMTTTKRNTERKTVWEHLQFRMLFITMFMWFLGQAVINRVKLVRQHELNCWQEAKRAASSVAPYAFMKI
ncbi:MAG: hypothetical protein L7U64_01675 [Luminiphilus sp.]|jgi:hypothetical protein|uniref:Uncharacterized protein n=1 Tax=Candidatus Paraluminiphilus aquimaris TaxID=2518994 RepID=A0ABY6Q6F5_9GAMM|nr:hypothetical protein [Candidatus Paraluminiphilus aquimaris]MAJ52606.1 hypothetical protein [Halieaceae bacterium]MCH1458885.1 hypothetical protein [Luminiphilus sp.]OUV05776.1 MAG: hypothetical protein CBC39_01050 [Cellvibrionales bacterium TMED79]UZP74470.1 hypothetical protein E0F26_06825 [Candidatus Paraluminiphilus aquimaris]|tara:strand:- start:1572 stop:1835 length:264 start_codon:yes stop_codon:yes gene_type:complete